VQTLKKLEKHIRSVRPNRNMGKVRLHDSARPHTGLPTGQDTATMGWTLLLHPPYSPDLAPSDPHLFRPLKDTLRGSRFADDGLKHSVSVQPRRFSRGFHTTGIERFTHAWKKYVDNEADSM
jgi:histone-lysine N-methyltransferase SETMAR